MTLVEVPSDPVVGEAELEGFGSALKRVNFLSIGGGLGSFAAVDALRVSGVPTGSIAVVSPLAAPYETFKYLTETSQIVGWDRLRSDSMSRIDNLWGFPSYAVTEARRRRTLRPLWTVMTEPILSEFYTPPATLVFDSIDREASRIGWADMLVNGRATAVRRHEDGGYVTYVDSENDEAPTVIWSRFVHIAIGHPGPRISREVAAYRLSSGDEARVINAYEPHDYVYDAVCNEPATVVLRGAGIASSRVLERLANSRHRDTRIIHLFRSWPDSSTEPRTFRRRADEGFSFQAFTFPKAAGGGQLRRTMLTSEPHARSDLLERMSGTTTASRRHWRRMLDDGKKKGWYQARRAELRSLRPGRDGRVVVEMRAPDGSTEAVEADYVIDAIGLDPDMRNNPFMADLVDGLGVRTNEWNRLTVSDDFEVAGSRSGDGRLYASGSITLGGTLAPSDSFWGLGQAAWCMMDDLARQGEIPRMGCFRSARQWLRWMRGRQP